VRLVGSSQANLFTSISGGINALWGPLHGGANQAVLEMLEKIRQSDGDVHDFVKKVKNKEDGVKLMGFGHRVYKNYDPRARIVKEQADKILGKLGGDDELLDIAKALEEVALTDDYFVERKLYPERRLLHRRDLPRDGLPDADVHRAVRAGPAAGLDRALARDARRGQRQDRPSAPDLHRLHRARLQGSRRSLTSCDAAHGVRVCFADSCSFTIVV
jgi:hypothetical protein